jgi:hypothetical protein
MIKRAVALTRSAELKFDGDVPDCITDNLKWIEDFILDKMWRPLLVSKGHAPNRRDDRNILFGYACFDNNWLVIFATVYYNKSGITSTVNVCDIPVISLL